MNPQEARDQLLEELKEARKDPKWDEKWNSFRTCWEKGQVPFGFTEEQAMVFCKYRPSREIHHLVQIMGVPDK